MRGRWCMVWWIGALLVTISGQAQTPYFQEHSVGRSFVSGAPGMLYTDRYHQLWMGSGKGLYRYQSGGQEHYPFPGKQPGQVTAVHQRMNSAIWVGYEDGSIAQIVNDRLEAWLPEEGVPKVPITAFAEDRAGQLWFATYGEGIYCLATNGRVYNFDVDDGLPSREIYDLCLGADGLIWAGTDNGIARCSFNPNKGKTISLLQLTEGLPDEIVLSLCPDNRGVWIGMHEGGVAYFDLSRQKFIHQQKKWSNGPVRDLLNPRPNELYLLNQSGSTLLLPLSGEKEIIGPPIILAVPKARAITLDIEGNLWLLSREGDLFSANLQFSFPTAYPGRVQAVAPRNDQEIWFGTEKGIYRGSPDNPDVPRLVPGTGSYNVPCIQQIILSPADGGDTLILAGTFGQGLLVCNTSGCRLLGEAEGLQNGNVLSIYEQDGQLWLATLGGVFSMSVSELFKNKPQINRLTNLGSSFIYQAFKDQNGALWVGTDGNGLLQYEAGKVTRHQHLLSGADTLTVNSVLSIEEGKDGIIWANAQAHGLLRFEDGYFHPAPPKNLHFDEGEEISALARDSTGRILVIYPDGIDVLSPDGTSWLSYGSRHGFNVKGNALNAVSKGFAGDLWFVAGARPGRYRPLPGEMPTPEVLISTVTAAGDTITGDANRQLSMQENNLIFQFRGNWLTDPEGITYRYLLRGRDPTWINSTDQRATYSSLPAGAYIFELEMGLYGQFDNSADVSFPFSILLPWWQRWWAIVSFVLLSSSFFIHFLRRKQRRQDRLHELERDRIRSELAAIKAQISPHFLFNSFSTLMATIEESPAQGVAYAEQLSSFFRYMLSVKESELVPLEEELELVKNFCFLLDKRYGNHLTVKLMVEDQSGNVPPMSIQALVENAVKHNEVSSRKPLTITIHREENLLTVKNPIQTRLQKEKSTGFGLTAIRKRYQLLGKQEVIVAASDDFFVVSLPIL